MHSNLAQLIQTWNCFILQQLRVDLSKVSTENDDFYIALSTGHVSRFSRPNRSRSDIEKIFGTKMKVTTYFRNGNHETKFEIPLMFTLKYPVTSTSTLCPPYERFSFEEIIKRSISSRIQARSWDSKSQRYRPTEQIWSLISLPKVLVLNCELATEDEQLFRKVSALSCSIITIDCVISRDYEAVHLYLITHLCHLQIPDLTP